MHKFEKVILGLGATGISCLRFLQAQGERVVIMDSRDNPPNIDEMRECFPDVPVYLGEFSAAILAQANELVVSQGISYQTPAIVQSDKPLISDIELLARYTQKPIVAITGSNGKSTVTSLLGDMAKACDCSAGVGGNLSPPALDLVTDPEPDSYILEVSNFQLEITHSLSAKVACLLNLSPDHLDRYASYDDYIAAKQRVYQQCEIAVVNRNDKAAYPVYEPSNKLISFGLDEPADGMLGIRIIDQVRYLAYGQEPLLPVSELPLAGKVNWQNALAALAIGCALDWPMPAMLSALKNYHGLAHRCELVKIINGVQWINDSKGSNVGATVAALDSIGDAISGEIIWIAGGDGKDADFQPLLKPVMQYVKQAILFGRDAKQVANALSPETSMVFAKNLHETVVIAEKIAKSGDAVLLSPACASFDSFSNFAERGCQFKQQVIELSE